MNDQNKKVYISVADSMQIIEAGKKKHTKQISLWKLAGAMRNVILRRLCDEWTVDIYVLILSIREFRLPDSSEVGFAIA